MIQGKEHGFRARTSVGLWLVCHSGSVLIRGGIDAACRVSQGVLLSLDGRGRSRAQAEGEQPAMLFQWKVSGPRGEFRGHSGPSASS